MSLRGPATLLLAGSLFVLSHALGTPGYDVPGLPFVCLAPFLSLAVSARSARHAAWRSVALPARVYPRSIQGKPEKR